MTKFVQRAEDRNLRRLRLADNGVQHWRRFNDDALHNVDRAFDIALDLNV